MYIRKLQAFKLGSGIFDWWIKASSKKEPQITQIKHRFLVTLNSVKSE